MLISTRSKCNVFYMPTCPSRAFNKSSRFFGVASATGTRTGPCPIACPVVSSKNCIRRLPASLGTSSISCCALALSAASVRCLLLGGGRTVAIVQCVSRGYVDSFPVYDNLVQVPGNLLQLRWKLKFGGVRSLARHKILDFFSSSALLARALFSALRNSNLTSLHHCIDNHQSKTMIPA